MNFFIKNKKYRLYLIFFIVIVILGVIVINLITTKKEPVELFQFPHHIPRTKQFAEKILNGVPLVIYESWHSHTIPRGMKDNITNLLEMNPEFDYYLYSDEDCAKFIESNFDEEILAAFYSLKPGAYKSDLWRYCILYKLGGVYLDIKFYTVVPLIDIISETPTVFVRDEGIPQQSKHCFYNGFMISPPNNEIFKKCIDDIVESCKNKSYKRNFLDITGPCLLGRVLTAEYSSDFEHSNLYGYMWNFYLGIKYKDTLIIRMYDNYRAEQKNTENNSHYGKLYRDKDVYWELGDRK